MTDGVQEAGGMLVPRNIGMASDKVKALRGQQFA